MPSMHHETPSKVTSAVPRPAELERPPCAVCNSVATRPLVVRKGYQVVRCRDCGLVYISPRPLDRETIDSLYTNPTYCNRQIRHADAAGRVNEARWRLDRVEQHATSRGRLLDVGCSAASFLLAARERGWNVAGLDISAGAIEYAKSVHGLDAKVGTLEETDLPADHFDVVTMFECIEHMRHPAAALRAANRVLKKDGLLVITTPNIDGLFPRVTYRLLGQTIGAWEHPTPPHHLYQFSVRTLSALLGKTGFEVVSAKTRPMGLRYTAQQLESAVIDAVKRGVTTDTQRQPRPSDAPGPGGRPSSKPRLWRRASRASVAGFSWALTLALYAIPVERLNTGDSMLLVARKA